jgi:hypothetical protein
MTRFLMMSVSLLALAGCNETAKRLNAPPHGTPAETSDLQGTFTYMVDNAMLADMTVTDNDFYPHRKMLNSLGEQRLSRFASLLDAYGGSLRYSTDHASDSGLVNDRLASIREFLTEAGIDTRSQIVTRDMAGGEGIEASEAILIRVNEGTYKPDDRGAEKTPVAVTNP